MKLNEFSSADRPVIAKFEELGDYFAGIIIKEPEWQDDPANAGKEMLVVVIQTDKGLYVQINGRTQMPRALMDAVADADVDEMVAGGHLTVTFIEWSGQAKIYKAVYEPPQEQAAAF